VTSEARKMLGITGYKTLAMEGEIWVRRLMPQCLKSLFFCRGGGGGGCSGSGGGGIGIDSGSIGGSSSSRIVGAGASKPVAISTGLS
jgi:hypothetical protein